MYVYKMIVYCNLILALCLLFFFYNKLKVIYHAHTGNELCKVGATQSLILCKYERKPIVLQRVRINIL